MRIFLIGHNRDNWRGRVIAVLPATGIEWVPIGETDGGPAPG